MVASVNHRILLWPLLLLFASAKAQVSLESTTVKQRQWLQAEYQLPAGPVSYREQASDAHSEGYFVETYVTAKGLHQRKIADFGKTLTGEYLYNALVKRIERYGFAVKYQCKAQDCGELSGWKTLVEPLLDGDTAKQYYLLAKAPTPMGEGYLSLHVADLDGQPRVVADIITADTSLRHLLDVVLFNDVFAYPPEQLINDSEVYFALNSHTPLADSDSALNQMALQLAANNAGHFIVVGHADNSGSALHNLVLSLARAQQVRQQLITQYNIDANRLSVAGAGASGADASFRKTVLVAAD